MIVAIKDPLKDSVPAAVNSLRQSGVNTRMITGDNIQTAIAIAIAANILPANWKDKTTNEKKDLESDIEWKNRVKYTCMEGPKFTEFVNIKDVELKQGDNGFNPSEKQYKKVIGNIANFKLVAKYLKVMANSSSESKYFLVQGL
jgi:magnesium-transporting ATPase (P-type)